MRSLIFYVFFALYAFGVDATIIFRSGAAGSPLTLANMNNRIGKDWVQDPENPDNLIPDPNGKLVLSTATSIAGLAKAFNKKENEVTNVYQIDDSIINKHPFLQVINDGKKANPEHRGIMLKANTGSRPKNDVVDAVNSLPWTPVGTTFKNGKGPAKFLQGVQTTVAPSTQQGGKTGKQKTTKPNTSSSQSGTGSSSKTPKTGNNATKAPKKPKAPEKPKSPKVVPQTPKSPKLTTSPLTSPKSPKVNVPSRSASKSPTRSRARSTFKNVRRSETLRKR